MPVERVPISSSQLAECLEVDAARFLGIEPDSGKDRVPGRFWIVLEPKEEPCKPAEPSRS